MHCWYKILSMCIDFYVWANSEMNVMRSNLIFSLHTLATNKRWQKKIEHAQQLSLPKKVLANSEITPQRDCKSSRNERIPLMAQRNYGKRYTFCTLLSFNARFIDMNCGRKSKRTANSGEGRDGDWEKQTHFMRIGTVLFPKYFYTTIKRLNYLFSFKLSITASN